MSLKKKLILCMSLVFIILIGGVCYYWHYSQVVQGFNPNSHIEQKCNMIKYAFTAYILETNDVELKNILESSDITKTDGIIFKLKDSIKCGDKTVGPYLRKDFNLSITNYGYKGFKVEINKSSMIVEVTPQKNLSECIIIIND